MSQIYSNASLVVTWVGMPDDDAWMVIALISRLKPVVDLWRLEKSDFTYFHNSDELFERTSTTPVKPEEWTALNAFFRRQYFSRVWTVQEIALSEGAIQMLGHSFIHWNDLIAVSNMIVACQWVPIIEKYAKPNTNIERPRLSLGAPAVYNYIRGLCKNDGSIESSQLQDVIRHSDTKRFYLLLHRLLHDTRYFRATDPRDNVYAVLSIALHVSEAAHLSIDQLRPDYHQSVRKVFIDTTREIARQTGSISFLSLVDNESKSIPNLPSWVPDFSASSTQVLAGLFDGSLYRAFNMVQRSAELEIMGDTLSLCAMRWDLITGTEYPESGFELQMPLDMCLKLPRIYSNGQTRVEALWRTLIADTDGKQSPASEITGWSFRQYVTLAVATRIRHILEGWDGLPVEVHDFISLLKLNDDLDEHPNPWLPEGREIELFWDSLQRMEQRSQENESSLRKLGQGAHLYAAAFESVRNGKRLITLVETYLALLRPLLSVMIPFGSSQVLRCRSFYGTVEANSTCLSERCIYIGICKENLKHGAARFRIY